MPAKKQQSSLAERLGAKAQKAFEEKKAEAAEFDSQAGLPSGIEGGVARLVECKFMQIAEGKQNAGKDMFYAAGVVVSPQEVNGVNIVGLRTQISEPLYATPTRRRKDVDDHIEWVMNELKKLGIDMSEMDLDDLENVAETLKEQQPYFRFRTWSGTKQEIEKRGGKYFVGTKGPYATEAAAKAANPYAGTEPMVQHTWNGACEYIEDEVDASVIDETEEVEMEEVEVTKKVAKAKAKKPAKKAELSLEELAAAADDGDQEAATKLADLAIEAGVSEEDIASAETWTLVLELMSVSEFVQETEEAEEEEEVDEWMPKKGEIYSYKAPGKKTSADCEVIAVFVNKETVNLKNLDDEKVYKAISWSKLDH